jgi:hypothetical protein
LKDLKDLKNLPMAGFEGFEGFEDLGLAGGGTSAALAAVLRAPGK